MRLKFEIRVESSLHKFPLTARTNTCKHLSPTMQATGMPIAVEATLKRKLAAVDNKHAELIKAVQSISDQVKMAEEQVDSCLTDETYTAKDALILAVDVDELLQTLTTILQVVSDGVCKTRMLNMPARHHIPNCESNNFAEKSNISMERDTTAVDVLEVPQQQMEVPQMEVPQQQVSSLQESEDTKLQEQETLLYNMHNSEGKDLHVRLQHVEAKLLLLQDVQVRDDKTIQNLVGEISTLKIDVMSLQDDATKIKMHQNALEVKTEEVRNKTDDIVRLRQILNNLHKNVTQREELTKKLNELQDNINTINSIMSPFMEKTESDPDVIEISD
ncbi:hypothetical protein BsWGS_00527 [Bradybaena similaris]